MSRVWLLDCPIDTYSLPETLEVIDGLIASGGLHQHCAINANKLVLMHKDREFHRIVANCSLLNADGQSVVWLLRLLGKPIKGRVPGIDLMEALVERAAQRGYRPFFLGARAEVVVRAVQTFERRHHQLQVAGFHHGYFLQDGQEEVVVRMIQQARPDILFVALDSPKKERWLARWMPALEVPFCMGVGGSFDVVAGRTKRAPPWMRRHGLEWLWRFSCEPRRLWKRYLLGNGYFLLLVMKELWSHATRTHHPPDSFA